ncbi:hypothetical protein S245_021578 [Arachis hypogaea]
MSPSVRPPTVKRLPKKRKNLKRSPPTTQQPPCAQTIVRPPTSNSLSSVSPSPPNSHVPPTVTPQTMQASSQGTTSRFMDFMPTLAIRGSSSTRWLQPVFYPLTKKGSTTAHLKEGSSGSSNSIPNP